MDSTMEQFEVRNRHYTALGGSLERFGRLILQFRNGANKSDEQKTSGRTFWSGPAECAEAVWGRGVRHIMQNLNGNPIRHVPLLRTEEGRRIEGPLRGEHRRPSIKNCLSWIGVYCFCRE